VDKIKPVVVSVIVIVGIINIRAGTLVIDGQVDVVNVAVT
jgi:hypothetical protein